MNRFAHLIDRVGYEPRRNAKGAADSGLFPPHARSGARLGAGSVLTGALSFRNAKPGLIRGLMMERTDPALFRLSRDYVGDLAETVALMWRAPPSLPSPLRGGPSRSEAEDRGGGPSVHSEEVVLAEGPPPGSASPSPPSPRGGGEGVADGPAPIGHNNPPPDPLTLAAVVFGLTHAGKSELPELLAAWLDRLDEIGRWATLKLITGELRIGVSARLAKTALASLGEAITPDDVEHVWHGLEPPYRSLFDWVEGRGERPTSVNPAPFRPPMLAHPMEDEDFAKLDPALFRAEWKWDGIRLQAVAGRDAEGEHVRRIYSRTGEDVSGAFPDLVEALDFDGALDGELLIVREGRVESFNVLQQRLNRKAVTPRMLVEYPAHLRVYDALVLDGEDLRERPFDERRARLERFVADLGEPRIDLSPQIAFASWDELGAARADPGSAGAGADADAIEGCMLKRADSLYLPGRPKGPWWKWKRDPYLVDAVMMYAQRGSGKRSSYYSDYTFGCWRDGTDGPELVPVGKAYSGFTDQELLKLEPVRSQQHAAALRPGPGGGVRARGRPRAGGRVRGIAALWPPQVGRRDAVSARQPNPLGQAGRRGRSARAAGAHPGPRRDRAAPRGRPCAGTPPGPAAGQECRMSRSRLTVETISSGPIERQAAGRLRVETDGQGFTDMTEAVARFVAGSGIRDGLATLFCRHTSASLTVQENADPDVRTDLLAALDGFAPRDAGYVHDSEGPDDMPAHIRAMLTGASLAVPILGGRLGLGTWQGLYLVEHRDRPHRREVVVNLIGT